VARGVRRTVDLLVVLAALALLWEAYRALALALGNVWPGTDVALPIAVRGTGNAQQFPHVWDIVLALGRPYRGAGQTLGAFLLGQAAYTLREVGVGFVLGATLGFGLGTLFAHSRLAERSLMPYVVASQTVPFLAFAPILVVATGSVEALPSWSGVALLATYLVFFPMTVQTLRGLRSTPATAEELLRSYGASAWTRMWRLRVPAAVPYLFIGAKVGATAAVVGAIVGELSAPGSGGIGAALFDFGRVSNNSLQLFATTLVAGLLGILSYAVVALAEWAVLRRFTGGARA
jgi:NitT/TauT family transport system permease protein